jgi:signal transduction histidine kinase
MSTSANHPSGTAVAAPTPGTALAAVKLRLRQRIWRTMFTLFAVCLGIAVMLSLLDGGRLSYKLIYSLCIGSACMLVNDTSYLAQAWLHDRLRALRGMSATAGSFARGWAGILSSSLLCVVIGPPLGQWVADKLTGFNTPGVFDLSTTNARITMGVSLLATILLVALLSGMERIATARADAEAAQRQAAEHQLRLLQSQLEPHMLFNTLANLRVLIGLDTQQAQAMLDRLIGYLRATLGASRVASHPLATEFDRIADYLALMSIRMGPRLRTRLELPEELAALQVPPLLLQPLVENAIKHGLEPHVQGGLITVAARSEGGQLVLAVRDTGAGLPTAPVSPSGSHFGVAQVRERLATLHGDKASFTLEAAPDEAGGTLATVRLPWPAIAPDFPPSANP